MLPGIMLATHLGTASRDNSYSSFWSSFCPTFQMRGLMLGIYVRTWTYVRCLAKGCQHNCGRTPNPSSHQPQLLRQCDNLKKGRTLMHLILFRVRMNVGTVGNHWQDPFIPAVPYLGVQLVLPHYPTCTTGDTPE